LKNHRIRDGGRLTLSNQRTANRFSKLHDKVDDVVHQCTELSDKLDTTIEVDVANLTEQVEQLKESIKDTTAPEDGAGDGLEKERREVMDNVETLKSLVDGTVQLLWLILPLIEHV
jgi:predicted  nucleic acid-binding Zn-ribbon protein